MCCSSHELCYGCMQLCAIHNSFASYDGDVIRACHTIKADCQSGHILDLYYTQLSNSAPFVKIIQIFILMQNTEKRDWMGEGGGGWNFWYPFFFFFQQKYSFFHKKVPFPTNIQHCPKFLEYALSVNFNTE